MFAPPSPNSSWNRLQQLYTPKIPKWFWNMDRQEKSWILFLVFGLYRQILIKITQTRCDQAQNMGAEMFINNLYINLSQTPGTQLDYIFRWRSGLHGSYVKSAAGPHPNTDFPQRLCRHIQLGPPCMFGWAISAPHSLTTWTHSLIQAGFGPMTNSHLCLLSKLHAFSPTRQPPFHSTFILSEVIWTQTIVESIKKYSVITVGEKDSFFWMQCYLNTHCYHKHELKSYLLNFKHHIFFPERVWAGFLTLVPQCRISL